MLYVIWNAYSPARPLFAEFFLKLPTKRSIGPGRTFGRHSHTSWLFGSAAVLCDVRSTIGLLSDNYTLLLNFNMRLVASWMCVLGDDEQ